MAALIGSVVLMGLLIAAVPSALLAWRRGAQGLAVAAFAGGVALPGVFLLWVTFGADGFYRQIALLLPGFPIVVGATCIVFLRVVSIATKSAK